MNTTTGHNEREREQRQDQSLKPSIVFDKALAFMAARWLCIGAPDRDELARQYCEASLEERANGITLRRVNQTELSKHLKQLEGDSPTKAAEIRQQIANGSVPTEFLLGEETIPHAALNAMAEWCDHAVNDSRVRNATFPSPDSSLKVGPTVYYEIEDRFQPFDLPHQTANISDSSLKEFFNALHQYSDPGGSTYYNSPSFEYGMGDATARQKLYLFPNGSFVHIVYNGNRYEQPGIYNAPDSDFQIRTPKVHIDSSISIFNSTPMVVMPIAPGETYVNQKGEKVAYNNQSGKEYLLVSSCEEVPQDVIASGKASLENPRLKLKPARSWIFDGTTQFLKKDTTIQQLEPVWLWPETGYRKVFAESHVLLRGEGYSPNPVAVMDKATIFFAEWGYPNVLFFPKGSVLSQSGVLLSDPDKTDKPLILFRGPREQPILSTYGSVAQLLATDRLLEESSLFRNI